MWLYNYFPFVSLTIDEIATWMEIRIERCNIQCNINKGREDILSTSSSTHPITASFFLGWLMWLFWNHHNFAFCEQTIVRNMI